MDRWMKKKKKQRSDNNVPTSLSRIWELKNSQFYFMLINYEKENRRKEVCFTFTVIWFYYCLIILCLGVASGGRERWYCRRERRWLEWARREKKIRKLGLEGTANYKTRDRDKDRSTRCCCCCKMKWNEIEKTIFGSHATYLINTIFLNVMDLI